MFLVTSVSLYVCNMVSLESLDIESSFLVWGYIFRDMGQVCLWRLSGQGHSRKKCVYVTCSGSKCWMSWPGTFIFGLWYIFRISRSSSIVHISRSSCQGQGHKIKESGQMSMAKYAHLHVICLRSEGNFVHRIITVDICEYCLAFQTRADVHLFIFRRIANDFSSRL